MHRCIVLSRMCVLSAAAIVRLHYHLLLFGRSETPKAEEFVFLDHQSLTRRSDIPSSVDIIDSLRRRK